MSAPLTVDHAQRTTSKGRVPPLPWDTLLSSLTASRVSLSPNITCSERESGKRLYSGPTLTANDFLYTEPVHTNFSEAVFLSHFHQKLVPTQSRYVCTYV